MSKWLPPQKMLDYHIVRRFGDVAEAERQLYLAVVRGDARARLNGKILGPEWLKQLCRMKISEASSFALPRNIQLAAEDAPRWRSRRTLHSVPVAEPPQHRLNWIISKGMLPPAPKSSLNRLDPRGAAQARLHHRRRRRKRQDHRRDHHRNHLARSPQRLG